MFTKKITKEALYLPASIMHHLSCLARMGEDSCIFLKIRFLHGKKNSVSESRKHIKDQKYTHHRHQFSYLIE